jgi:hypothetical protein
MAKVRDKNHRLADQVKAAAERQEQDKERARKVTEEGRTASDRPEDVRAAHVAEEQPDDAETQAGEVYKAEQGDADLDILDPRNDNPDDPHSTRMTRIPAPGEGIDNPDHAAARLPEHVEQHHEKVAAAYQKEGGGGNLEYRDLDQIANQPVENQEVATNVGRNFRQEPTTLIRDADAGDNDTVHLDRRHALDPDAPKGGQEGGAKLGEPDTAKKDPGAPWPGPQESLAAAPTPSPEPGPEPTVQYEPPQGILFAHKPEAAVGLRGPDAAEQKERVALSPSETAAFHAARAGTTPPEQMRATELNIRAEGQKLQAALDNERNRPALVGRDDGVKRDEAGQISIEHLIHDVILAAVGKFYQGVPDEPAPHRLRIALEQAARRVMSGQWWDIHSRHFASDDKPAA